ncbi:hypothetical protein [Castellaniella sp.]|uniref:hypothetical protein n=1 Tax=Castellaniella sp. TaxID=1955812 RepID=UPI003C78DA2D
MRSRLEVEVSAIDPSLSVPGGPSLKTRRTATEFNVRAGQTLVLAGFLSRDTARNVDRLPGLGDLPVLGALFRSTRFQRNETELAILVTPQLVTAEHPDLRLRVRRAGAILDRSFPADPVLMTPVRPGLAPVGRAVRPGWNPRMIGPDSQWQGSIATPDHRPEGARP